MSQRFQILIKNISPTDFTGVTTNLSLEDSYFSYDQSGLNQGVVTEFNVRQYLDDPKNEQVSTDFFNYLTINTNDEELREIVESNLKLSIVFRQYYTQSILSGTTSPTSFVDEQLVQNVGTDVIDYFKYTLSGAAVDESIQLGGIASIRGNKDNSLNNSTREMLSFSTEESYYINFQINKTYCETSRVNFFDEFSRDVFGTVERNNEEINVLLKQEFVVVDNPDKDSFWHD